MFNFCCGKKSVCVAESVDSHDAPAAKTKDKQKSPWWHQLFGRPLSKQLEQKSKSHSTKKKPKWSRLFCRKKRFVSPTREEHCQTKQGGTSPRQDEEQEPKQHFLLMNPGRNVDEKEEQKKNEKGPAAIEQVGPSVGPIVVTPKPLRKKHFMFLGFPNPAQNCYMNSCLQSLMNLEDFVNTIHAQEQVWGSLLGTELIRSFMRIKEAYYSKDMDLKSTLLDDFKMAVAHWAPEFNDDSQQDAHEFITAIFGQMSSFSPTLHQVAMSMGKSYMCPVEDHFNFKMLSTRTCKSCGEGSVRQEEFTNLSLNLDPGCETVDEMLANYLTEEDLEYKCACGSILSSQRSSFETMPKVLILHLKRFRFTPSYELEKACNSVHLNRDLVVSSEQEGCCYSLVSIVNHIGTGAEWGHYISDGVDPDVTMEDPTDRWFTYDDARVTDTSGSTLTDQRERSAYILFYKRHQSE